MQNIITKLKPLKGKPLRKKIFAFDVETADNGKTFVCGSIAGNGLLKTFLDKDEMIQFFTTKPFWNSYVSATNLMYDFYCLFDIKEAFYHFNIIERQGSLIMAKSDISKNAFTKPNKKFHRDIVFFDSLSHLKASVEEIGKIVTISKLEHPEFLGEMPKNKEQWDYMIRYNQQDAMITYRFMEFLQNTYNSLGGSLKITVSSSAMDLFRRSYLTHAWTQEPKEHINLVYKGYYGGRTETLKRGEYENVRSYDFNSLYPFCMKNFEYPYPNGYLKDKLTTEEIEQFNGVCKVTVKAPDSYFPFLPLRTDKLLFPTGRFTGYYDFASLRKSMDLGYEFEKIENGIIYEHTFRPFQKFISDLYKLRHEYKARGDISQLCVKLILNSSYGKFGYQYKNKEIITDPDGLVDYVNDCSIFPVNGDLSLFRVVTGENSKIPSYVFPIISTYVTSYARLHLYKAIENINPENVFYMDTDSIFTKKKLCSSQELGDLKEEHHFEKILFVKPKMYAGTDNNNPYVKIKGVGRKIDTIEEFKRFVDGEEAKYINFTKLRTALKNPETWINRTFEAHKKIDVEDTKRHWINSFSYDQEDSEPKVINMNCQT